MFWILSCRENDFTKNQHFDGFPLQTSQKNNKMRRKRNPKWANNLENLVWGPFNSVVALVAILDETWSPRWSPKSMKIHKNVGPKIIIKSITFLVRCFSMLDRFWELFWRPRDFKTLHSVQYFLQNLKIAWCNFGPLKNVLQNRSWSDFGSKLGPKMEANST